MSFEEFLDHVRVAKAERPKAFLLESEPAASDASITSVEAALGVELPAEYRAFAKEFGGGFFGFANVFCAEESGFWSIVERNKGARSKTFVSVSDNGTGDLYGFLVRDGRCASAVSRLDHEESRIDPAIFADLFEYLVTVALRPR